MEKNRHKKLFSLWLALTKSEKRALQAWLDSPYVTRRTDLKRLYGFLRKWDRRASRKIDDQELYRHIFGEEGYDDAKLRGSLSDLGESIQDMVLHRQAKEDHYDRYLRLLKLYQTRGLSKHYSWMHRKIERELKKHPWRNDQYYHIRLHWHEATMEHNSQQLRSGELNLQAVADDLDSVYIIQKLRQACTQRTHQAVYQTPYDYGLLPYWIEELPKMPAFAISAIQIYYYCYRFLTDNYSLAYFQKFTAVFYEKSDVFPPAERKNIYLLALNFCIRWHNRGNEAFTRETWRLYRFALDQKLLTMEGRLSRFTFNNIVGIAIKLREFPWAEAFIAEYQQHIDATYRNSSVSLNKARLLFEQGHFDRALPYLQNADRKDRINDLIARTLLIKIFYETGAEEALFAQLDNLEQFLRREKLSQYHRDNFSNFLKFMRQILSLPPHSRTDMLGQSILECDPLSEKDWLIKQLPSNIRR